MKSIFLYICAPHLLAKWNMKHEHDELAILHFPLLHSHGISINQFTYNVTVCKTYYHLSGFSSSLKYPFKN